MEFVFYMLNSNKTSAVALHTVRSINNPNAIRTSSVKFKYRCYFMKKYCYILTLSLMLTLILTLTLSQSSK